LLYSNPLHLGERVGTGELIKNCAAQSEGRRHVPERENRELPRETFPMPMHVLDLLAMPSIEL
jgi:hypothetical protein